MFVWFYKQLKNTAKPTSLKKVDGFKKTHATKNLWHHGANRASRSGGVGAAQIS